MAIEFNFPIFYNPSIECFPFGKKKEGAKEKLQENEKLNHGLPSLESTPRTTWLRDTTLGVNQNIILFNIVGQGEGRSPGIGIGKTGSIIHLF